MARRLKANGQSLIRLKDPEKKLYKRLSRAAKSVNSPLNRFCTAVLKFGAKKIELGEAAIVNSEFALGGQR
jgi:hypothetical protein